MKTTYSQEQHEATKPIMANKVFYVCVKDPLVMETQFGKLTTVTLKLLNTI